MVIAFPARDDEDLATLDLFIDFLQVLLICVLLGDDSIVLSDISGDASELTVLCEEGRLHVERLLGVYCELGAWAELSAVDG